MEHIIHRNIKWFYAAMIVLYACTMIQELTSSRTVGIISVASAGAATLYVVELWYSRKGKYVESRQLLLVLAGVTAVIWAMQVFYDPAYTIVTWTAAVNSGIQCFLIEWVLIMRASTIKRLIYIAEKSGGDRWIA